jgi:hypothetical protein
LRTLKNMDKKVRETLAFGTPHFLPYKRIIKWWSIMSSIIKSITA